MGEVYRARDTTLGREVALKALPGPLAADEGLRQRLTREARVLASLNHPNIVTIHAVDCTDGDWFLAMELVHGRPLSELIPRDGLPLPKLLAIALAVAEAVVAAHARGILHRDLKPANVMVAPDGIVKVLDFGLAKSLAGQHADDVTATASDGLTSAGRILGTVAYMSPEQAEGKNLDERSDIFSLGVMLYEMATGRRPFTGETPLATLTAILRDVPPPAIEVKPSLSRDLGRVIRRALAKDPDRRQQTVRDLRNDLDEIRQELESPARSPVVAESPPAGSRGWRSWVGAAWALSLVAAAAIGAAVSSRFAAPREVPATEPAGAATGITVMAVTSEDGLETFPSLSPDGRWVVYARDDQGSGQTDILLRAVGGLTTINLTRDSTADDGQPAFSPDGERIAFRSEREGGGLFVMGRTGESARRLTTEGFNPSWSPDGTAVVYGTESIGAGPQRSTGGQLVIVSTASGERRPVITAGDAVQPSWSPNGHRIAYWGFSGENAQRDIWTVAPGDGAPVRVTSDPAVDWNPVWSPDGRHLYFSSDRAGGFSLWRVAVDEASGRPRGAPEPVPLPRSEVAHFSFTRDGARLAMSALAAQSNLEALTFDPQTRKAGQRRRLTNRSEPGTFGPRDAPSLSPDGQWLVFADRFRGQQDLWVVRTDGTGLRRLTDDGARDANPSWFPDGQRVMFRSDRSGRWQVWTIAADGGSPTQVADMPGAVQRLVLSPDGGRAISTQLALQGPSRYSLVMFNPGVAAGHQRLEELPQPPDGFFPSMWSPDGSRILGWTGERITVYSVGARTYEQFGVATTWPVWRDDRTVLYRDSTGRELRLFDTATKVSTLVFRSPDEQVGGPVLSPEGRQIYFFVVKPQGDIVIAHLAPPPSR